MAGKDAFDPDAGPGRGAADTGVSFSTAGGFADVRWPLTIRILTAGEDGKFHEIGDLVELSAQQHGPLVPKKASDAYCFFNILYRLPLVC